MRDIQELIENVDRYKHVYLQRRFESKKNTVAYVVSSGHPRILKWYVPGLKKNMDNEYSVLKKGFSDLSIPSPLEKDDENNVLVMSYIIGENVCDIVNNTQKVLEEKNKVVESLAEWLVAFHTFFKSEQGFRIRGDASLRNFLLRRGQIWGVDFEESRMGKPSEDLATSCASLLSTTPMFTDEKFQLCQTLLDSYRKTAKWDVEHMNAEISYALLERIQWRPNDEALLRKVATQVRNHGLQGARHHL
jgi:tRNA A-37 threonylcarbamoyl transferase component Bud32